MPKINATLNFSFIKSTTFLFSYLQLLNEYTIIFSWDKFYILKPYFKTITKRFIFKNKINKNFLFTEFTKPISSNSRLELMDNVVSLKRKIGYVKTHENVRKTVLRHHCDNFNMTSEKLYFLTSSSQNRPAEIDLHVSTINVTNKFKLLFEKNRNIFRYFYKAKNIVRQFQFDKKFNKFFRATFISLLFYLEYTLFNLLLTSRFVFSKKNFLFLLNLECLYINGVQTNTTEYSLNIGDVIQLTISKQIFFLYRILFNSTGKLTAQANSLVWRLNRHTHSVYKQKPTHLPRWLDSFLYINGEVPRYLEIDYSIFTIIVLQVPNSIEDFSWYSWKFLNLFLLRLYSWRYII